MISLGLLLVLSIAALGISFFNVNRTVTVRGAFEYRDTYPVISLESGVVREIVVEVDQTVSKGDVLIVLENKSLKMEIADLESRISLLDLETDSFSAKNVYDISQFVSDLELLRKQQQMKTEELEFREELYDVNLAMYERKSIAKHQYDEVRLAYLAVRLEMDQIESSLIKKNAALREFQDSIVQTLKVYSSERKAAEAKLQYLLERQTDLTVRSPAAGVLHSTDLEYLRGAHLSASTHIADVVSLDDIDFVGFAIDADIIRVKEGQEAYFDVDIFRRKAFVKGTVTRVGHMAKRGPDGRNLFPVRVEVDNPTFFDRGQLLYIQAGVSGDAVIITEKGLSLIELVWEKILKLTDFQVYAQ